MEFSKISARSLASTLALTMALGSLALPASAQIARSARYVPPQHSRTTVVPGAFVFILRPAVVTENTVVQRYGSPASLRSLRPGETVRVTAVQVGPNRWRASRIDVVQPLGARARVGGADIDDSSDVDRTYVDRTYVDERTTRRGRWGGADRARLREYYGDRFDFDQPSTAYTGTGDIESIDRSSGSFVIRVGRNTRRVYADLATYSGVTSFRALRKGDRVRVAGDLYGRDVFADAVRMLD
jgi:hypothetical protein